MKTIAQTIKFVKSRQAFHTKKYEAFKTKAPHVASRHKDTSDQYQIVIDLLDNYPDVPAVDDDTEALFSLNPLNLQGLPEDLEEEINVSQSEVEDAQIVELLTLANRSLDLNELLVGCYRKYEVIHKRNMLTARIYRLIKRDLVHNVGKGRYALGRADDEAKLQLEISGVLEDAT